MDKKNVIAYINLGIIILNRYNQLYEALDCFNHAIENGKLKNIPLEQKIFFKKFIILYIINIIHYIL